MGGPTGEGSSNKIFVGGLPQNCADEVLSNYFMQYGTITDSVVMKDRETGNSRGFGFVTYETTDAVDMVMAQYDDHKINDKWVEVKRATPRDQMPPGGGGKGKGKDKGGGSGGDRGGDQGQSPMAAPAPGAYGAYGAYGAAAFNPYGAYGAPPAAAYGAPPAYGAPAGYPGYPPAGYPGYPPAGAAYGAAPAPSSAGGKGAYPY